MRQTDSARARQEPHPIGNENKQKNRRNQRKSPTRLSLIPENALNKRQQSLKNGFENILSSPRHKHHLPHHNLHEKDQKNAYQKTDEKSIDHRKAPDTEKFFCGDRYFHLSTNYESSTPARLWQKYTNPLFLLSFLRGAGESSRLRGKTVSN